MNKFLLAIFIISVLTLNTTSALPTDEGPIVITVKEKWTKVIDKYGVYLFSDTGGNVYSIEDTWWHWDFVSANRYAIIEPGKSYKMWFFGLRIPFLSKYQNAYRIENV